MREREQINNHLLLFIGSLLFSLFLFNFFSGQNLLESVLAQSTVSVSATVPTSVTCNLSNNSTSFGEITPASIATANPNITLTISCNSAGGCIAQVKDQGNNTNPGLYNATSSHLIPSSDATLQAGTEGYGIQAATTSNGSGGTLSLNPKYNKTGNDVGGLSTSYIVIASSSQPVANREVVVTHKAAVSGLTPAGDYSDTITYNCTGN